MAGYPYFPHTEDDVRSMLERIGVKQVEDLYADVPKEFIKKGAYALPDAMSEPEVRAWLNGLAGMNARMKVFVGTGAYDHYTPSVIPYITSRSEFLTAYTPYQCEISQGTLRYIFEYQSMVCTLTGLDVSTPLGNFALGDGVLSMSCRNGLFIAKLKQENPYFSIDGNLEYDMKERLYRVKAFAKPSPSKGAEIRSLLQMMGQPNSTGTFEINYQGKFTY